MPHDTKKIITLSRADSDMVASVTRSLVEKLGFEVTIPPIFGADGGGARLERDELGVHLQWSREEVLVVSTRNRKFEKTRDSIIDLVRSLKSRDD